MPSWYGKQLSEMTEDEKIEYHKSQARRFTWEEGDLQLVGHEPLTDEEKEFVRQLKAQEETNNKSGKLYYLRSGSNKFFYDVDEEDPEKAITLKTSDETTQKYFEGLLKLENFIDYQGQLKSVAENLEEFFKDYIPHIFRLEDEIVTLEPIKSMTHSDDEILNRLKTQMEKNFSLSLTDFPFPETPLYVIPNNFLIGSKEALKELFVAEGHINHLMESIDNYFLMGYWGHGMNSYAFYYVWVDSKRKIFFRLPFGGAYTNNEKSTRNIQSFFGRYLEFEKKIKDQVKKFTAVRSMGRRSYYVIEKENGDIIEFNKDRGNREDPFEYLLNKINLSK